VVVALLLELTLFELAVLEGGCLPHEDLSTYSSAWENRPAPPDDDSADAANDTALEAGGGASGGGGVAPSAGSGGSISDAGDAGVAELDAGSLPAVVDSGAETELDGSSALLTDAASAPP
jgi:hypothetical protein